MCVLFLGLGIWTMMDDSARIDAERVAKLPAVEARQLRNRVGSAVLLEGKLGEQATKAPEGFIAYQQESYLRTETEGASRGTERWQSVGTVKPELRVGKDDDWIVVAAETYRLDTPPHFWKTDVLPRYVSVQEATQRYRGFKAGDVVTVDGVVTGSGVLQATVLFGGNAAAYRASAVQGIATAKIVGGILTGFGVLLAIVVLVMWRFSLRGASTALWLTLLATPLVAADPPPKRNAKEEQKWASLVEG